MINQMFTIRALSSIHCGIGQGLNDIDLPTARNSVSGHPLIPGSSLKGVLKDEFTQGETGKNSGKPDWEELALSLFGGDGSDEFASAISVGDANLLALPVRSFFGTFAFLVSPYTLQQLKTLCMRTGKEKNLPGIPATGLSENSGHYKVQLPETSLLEQTGTSTILLEEMDLLIDADRHSATQWADIVAPLFFFDEEGRDLFKKRFAIVDDNVLNFLCDSALPVDARIAIDHETGTVKSSALWYEETVPAESLFVGHIGIDRSYNSAKKATAEDLKGFLVSPGTIDCQIGGKATTGKGFVLMNFSSVEA